ncbi:MAG: hypothetical protein JXB13_02565 [Phycisphaerae bacterium]|nr:hypothetical protein [Phycisphaerae bacterium]
MSDPLARLIRDADAAARPGRPLADGLADRVRRKAQRRTRTRAAGVAASALLLMGLGGWWLLGTAPGNTQIASPGEPKPPAVTPTAADPAELRAEIGRLESEIRTRGAAVDALLACEKNRARLAVLQRELDRPDPLEELRGQIAGVADVALESAERRCGSGVVSTACAAGYKRIVDLFPQTPAADTARQRLNEIETSPGDMS